MKTLVPIFQSLLIAVLIGACASGGSSRFKNVQVSDTQTQQYLQDKPTAFHPYYEVALKQGERNAVLNYMRIGLANLKVGNFYQAGLDLTEAINRIETIYADNPQAKKARSKFTPEYVKDFKGDSYERAMAMFYRGLVFLEQDDYENARASMLAGLEQDAMAEDTEYAKDFGMLYYLAGWASQCAGDHVFAEDLYAEAAKFNRYLIRPPGNDDDLLVLVFVNRGPIKKRTGEYKEKLYYTRYTPIADNLGLRDFAVDLSIQGRPIELALAEDIYFQAATRGGRAVDSINAGKAVFKKNTDAMGDAMTGAGIAALTADSYRSNASSAARGPSSLAKAGAILSILGAASKITSRLTTPEADIRYWDNLPEFVYFKTLRKDEFRLPLRAIDMEMTVRNDADQPVAGKNRIQPLFYANQVTNTPGCDWVGLEPPGEPLPFQHVNR